MATSDEALDRAALQAAGQGSLLFHLFLAEALGAAAVADAGHGGRVDGWAIDVGSDGYEAVALDGRQVVARVSFAADGSPLLDARAAGWASPRQLGLARARAAAADFARSLEGRRTALALPPADDAAVTQAYVIRLAPADQRQVAVGPHLRLSLRGDEVTGVAPAVDLAMIVPEPVGGERLPLVHGLEPTPSPMHVFLSLNHGLVLEIATPASGATWLIDGERVRRTA